MTNNEIATLMNDAAGQHWGDEAHFQRFANMLLAAEREACAKVCEGIYTNGDGAECWLQNAAAAIRARRNK